MTIMQFDEIKVWKFSWLPRKNGDHWTWLWHLETQYVAKTPN